MKREVRNSNHQLALIAGVSALCGAGLTLAIGNLRPSAASAAERNRTSLPNSAPYFAAPGTEDEKNKTAKSCPVVHFEIGCKDNEKTQSFYTQLFDWKIDRQSMSGVIGTRSKEGIQGHITSLGHEPEHYVTFYVQVDDLKAYLEKAKTLGGKTLVPAIAIPTGKFAWLGDPDGNIIGLLQPKKTAKK